MASLPPEEWRYWVIAFESKPPHQVRDNSEIGRLQASVNLLKEDWDIGFGFLQTIPLYGPAFFLRDNQTFTFLEAHKLNNEPLQVTADTLREVGAIFSLLKATEKSHPETWRIVQRFSMLKSFPRKSDMVALGYFSVIEALITHDPSPKEEYDSLNHQISTKMPLLTKRFERQMDYEKYFGQVEQQRVWKKLYSYRSALAHGASVEFKAKFPMLKDTANVLEFLKEASKLTLLFAIKEPEFVADLKKC